MRRAWVLLIGGLASVSAWQTQPLDAQSPSDRTTKAEFEAASIKPSKTAGLRGFFVRPGGATATNATLRYLIQIAYAYSSGRPLLYSFQVVNGPTWMDGDLWDIDATSPPTGAAPDMLAQLRLQSLLADRFKLKIRTEARELPTYALVLARSDRRLGPSLRPSTLKCAPPGSPAPPDGSPESQCGLRNVTGRMSGRGVALSALAAMLGGFPPVARMTRDKTGLTGVFDLDLEWTPTTTPTLQAGGAQLDAGAQPSASGTPLFTAIQEQLGLKLEAEKGPVDVFIVESAERPTPN